MKRSHFESGLRHVDAQNVFVEAPDMTEGMTVLTVWRVFQKAFAIGHPNRSGASNAQRAIYTIKERTNIDHMLHHIGACDQIKFILERKVFCVGKEGLDLALALEWLKIRDGDVDCVNTLDARPEEFVAEKALTNADVAGIESTNVSEIFDQILGLVTKKAPVNIAFLDICLRETLVGLRVVCKHIALAVGVGKVVFYPCRLKPLPIAVCASSAFCVQAGGRAARANDHGSSPSLVKLQLAG